MAADYQAARAALRDSHTRLSGIVNALSEPELTEPSYCGDWNLAQVLSHLGSGAEIGLMQFQAILSGAEVPSRESYPPIWDKWNARSPAEVQSAALPADAALLAAYEGADDGLLQDLHVNLMGRELDAAGLFARRLGEHALHTWDLEVMRDAHAKVASSAVEVLIDRLSPTTARLASGKRPDHRGRVELLTSGPSRKLVLDLSGETVSLSDAGETGDASVSLPSEAALRLFYGRLDEAHTPAEITVVGPVGLTELRALFPGN